ncbi:MAG: DUF5107 domain-containing protein [Lachnospiraceae bacterium]|nr:DUF5107 domain-containing protein [Lachnospiraceae bacterium]MCM1215689.1 DUF5107 domain-containing protein [Lachnospiraceae bacterium]MCM1238444.1 DUF5107 domain-containing protein [Lachnospiraceae bacterium]
MNKVTVRQEKVTIPTYETAAYDKNPMFLEKRVYQGSSGRVYPHPVCEGVADVKTDRKYDAIFLENDYILVMILPELGGRIQRLYDKTNGYDAVYYNEVIKPALVGLAGPWISGGIEFNWPQHHRPSTYDPVDCTVEEHEDGSVTVWVGEIEKMFHTKGMAGFTVYPDKAYLEIRGQVYNPTDRPQTFLWWANPAVAVNDHTQSIFPPDVTAVMDHGKRDVSKFPIADGVYYKVNYAPGTDISRYKNIPVPTSYMAYHSDLDFIGNYDHFKNAGLLHIADHHVSPGKKQWTWGCGDFGKAWDRNLTDENGPYIELMTGMFTDNQPDFTYLKPYEEKSFVQYFMPYKDAGAVKNASTEAVLNLEFEDGRALLTLYSPVESKDLTVELFCGENAVYSRQLDLSPLESFRDVIPMPECCFTQNTVSVTIRKAGREILRYTPTDHNEPVPAPAEALPEPSVLETTEKLFLAATHLEQYRHATYSPEDYYLEGLRRDDSDIRLNNGYGKYLYNKGRFADSEAYFRRAIRSSTWKNPNPYDCEPYFNLGLALKIQGKINEAYDAFYKAVWDGNMQDKAFYQLACIAAGKGLYGEALDHLEKSLARGFHNLKARTLKTALLRLTGQRERAVSCALETASFDPLDHGACYELYLLGQREKEQFSHLLRGDAHNYIELALCYSCAGLCGEAADILRLVPDTNAPLVHEPLVHYYLYFLTNDPEELRQAESADSLYCFPNRLEDIPVLQKAVENQGSYAAYYLGDLLYDRGRWEEAQHLWEQAAEQISLPTVHRNLSLVYYNKLHDAGRAKASLEKAFSMDTTDARVFFELDQLYKAMNLSAGERLAHMETHRELLEQRDDLYTEYITLLNLNGRYEESYEKIMSHNFHPWEGGEGKVPAQYRISLIQLAKKEITLQFFCTSELVESHRSKAASLLQQALVYPRNLGEGKLIGNMDNDIYYLLGTLYNDPAKSREAYELASRGEFNLSSAMYYNDQPPQMMYYAALALQKLGQEEEAEKRFDAFIQYAEDHKNDEVKIEYFAVSLPDFLIFEGDLNKNNQVHCCLMAALGHLGKGEKEQAKQFAAQGLKLNACHFELAEIVNVLTD